MCFFCILFRFATHYANRRNVVSRKALESEITITRPRYTARERVSLSRDRSGRSCGTDRPERPPCQRQRQMDDLWIICVCVATHMRWPPGAAYTGVIVMLAVTSLLIGAAHTVMSLRTLHLRDILWTTAVSFPSPVRCESLCRVSVSLLTYKSFCYTFVLRL